MARKREGNGGRVRRAVEKIAQVFHRKQEEEAPQQMTPAHEAQRAREPEHAAKRVMRTSDIGTDVLNRTYTPPVTSAKAGFRSDGSDHQSDQELVPSTTNERWNDEDRFTNKSGDPRIGTHGRTYEPGEIDERRRT